MLKFLTTKEFIQKATMIHKNFYSYSCVEYIDCRTPVIINCPTHGNFLQMPYKHLSKQGCPKCGRLSLAKTMSTGKELFIQKARSIHNNKYDYSKIFYKNTNTLVIILCPNHGEFLQTPKSHLKGSGCPRCSFLKKSLTTECFINRANIIHNNKYNYNKVKYKNNHTKVEIICFSHGNFLQYPSAHLAGYGCAKCSESLGEKQIRKHLLKIKQNFMSQYTFNNCRNINPLPFDFAVLGSDKLIGLIEYQGKQHFDPKNFFAQHGNFERIMLTDSIKAKYCKDNNIPLLIIPYTEKNNIENLVDNFVVNLGV